MTWINIQARRALLAKRFGVKVTNAEIVLHERMAKEGFRFKSQWNITTANGFFTVDFLVTGYKRLRTKDNLVVEVRGESHYSESGRRKDGWKSHELRNAGYQVLWIENEEVYNNLDQVIEKIRKAVVNGVVDDGEQ